MVNHEWISANRYAKETGLGVEKVKQFIKAGKIEGQLTEDGYYKVKVYKNDSVPYKQYEEVLKEKVELETKLASIKAVVT